MTPDQVADKLNFIADKIRASTNPSLSQVASDLRMVLAHVIDAGAPARQGNGPGGRRVTPSQSAPVDVSDPKAYQEASKRVASKKPV
jgi:hypothetical protein